MAQRPDLPTDAGEPPATPAASAGTFGSSRARRIWVRLALGLATVLAVFAIFATWANRQLLNPSNWSKTSTALLQKQTIRSSLSTYLIDQLYANVNVPAQLKSGLPTRLQPLAGPISGALHNVAEQTAEKALETPRVQEVWKKANRAADQTLVTIVEGGGSRVQIQGGTVSLNLRQVVADLPDTVEDALDLPRLGGFERRREECAVAERGRSHPRSLRLSAVPEASSVCGTPHRMSAMAPTMESGRSI